MKILVIYDTEGNLITLRHGDNLSLPVGVPYIYENIPQGKYIDVPEGGKIVDVTVTPHQLILEDVPPSETEILKERVKQSEDALIEIAELLMEVLG